VCCGVADCASCVVRCGVTTHDMVFDMVSIGMLDYWMDDRLNGWPGWMTRWMTGWGQRKALSVWSNDMNYRLFLFFFFFFF